LSGLDLENEALRDNTVLILIEGYQVVCDLDDSFSFGTVD
jgi:hypothetical protein